MPLDPRIALQGIGFEAPDILGAVRQGQDIRKNNMAMQRARDAGIALSNFMAPPPTAEVAPAMAPGNAMGAGRGPAITGAPLPPANAMRGGMPPAPRARRDISALLPYADDPNVKAVIDQVNREETAAAQAAAQAVDDARLGDANTRARVEFTIDQSLPHWGFASRNPTDEALAAAVERTLAIPGVDPDLVRQTYAPVLALPLEERAAYMADVSSNYASARAAEQARTPAYDNFNAGDRITFRPQPGRARMPGTQPADIAVSLTPGQQQTQENRAEDQDREWSDKAAELDADVDAARTALSLARPGPDRDAAQTAYGEALARRNAHNRADGRRASDGPPPRANLPPPGAEGTRIRGRSTNKIYVVRNGQWVEER
jgi:hypothetical protein